MTLDETHGGGQRNAANHRYGARLDHVSAGRGSARVMGNSHEGPGKFTAQYSFPAVFRRAKEFHQFYIAAVDIQAFQLEIEPDIQASMGGQFVGDNSLSAQVRHRANAFADDQFILRPVVGCLRQMNEVFAVVGIAHVKIVVITGNQIHMAIFQRLDGFFAHQLG